MRSLTLALLALAPAVGAFAQAGFPVYTDHLVNGLQDWGWAPHDFANASPPIHSGANSVSVSIADSSSQGLQMVRAPFDSSPYASVTLWINGGTGGGQKLQVYGLAQNGSTQNVCQASFSLGTLQTNTWQQFTIPLSSLGIANKSNCTGIVVQDRVGAVQPTFYLDDIQFNAKPAPALVQLSVNATQAVRSVDARWFGANTAVWDSNFDTPTTTNALRELGFLTLRFPGGSLSDNYDWATGKDGNNNRPTRFPNFMHVATNAGAQVFITVNYGTGTPAMAAGWVRSAIVTNHCNFKYWEIGNECYGSWETDTNVNPHDPYTYAVRATNYIAQMKAADPTLSIKVGIVVATGENSYSNVYCLDHPAVNPRTGQTNYGWTPILLTTLKNLGVTPDFAVHHVYPEYTDSECDPLLLQSASSWANDAADLRQQIAELHSARRSPSPEARHSGRAAD